MRSIIGRNLVNLCFTNFKRSNNIPDLQPKYFYQDVDLDHVEEEEYHNIRSVNASAGGDSIVTKTFNSLYDDYDDGVVKSPESVDIATVYASQRFFFASPGRSNSIVDSSSSSLLSLTSPSSSNPPEEEDRAESDAEIGGGVAVPTYSPDPYLDFRRSMEEMVEARNLFDVRSNWECLHELLLCYLALNPKSNHKFIVGAFSDLLVGLMDSQSGTGERGAGGG